MDLLSAIQSEALNKIQEIVLKKGLPVDSTWLDYKALNKALVCKRKNVAKWLIKLPCRVNIDSEVVDVPGNTPLHNAVKLGDIEIVNMLLECRASIVAINDDKDSALHLAFLYRYDKITDRLLDYIIKFSNYPMVENNEGISHLHIASARNNATAIEGFIKSEADINNAVKSDSPSCWAGYTALHFAIEFRSLEAAKILMAAGSRTSCDISTEKSPLQLLQQHQNEHSILSDHLAANTFSHFHIACLNESASTVKKFIDKGTDINSSIKWGPSFCHHYTPLQCAIESSCDRMEKVQLLLHHGAALGKQECLSKQIHTTALHLAFYNEYQTNHLDDEIVNLLYEAVKDEKENIVDENGLSYLHVAVTRNDFDTVKVYLDNGANINQKILQNCRGFSGFTALHLAVEYELFDMAKFLIEQGAKVDTDEDIKNKSPLLFKVFQTGNLSLIKFLFHAGARIGIRSNTLLHCAVDFGNHEIVRCLVGSGQEIDLQNDIGETPLMRSLDNRFSNKEVIDILLGAGASICIADDSGYRPLDIVNTSEWLNKDIQRFFIYNSFIDIGHDLLDFYLLRFGSSKDINSLLSTNISLSKVDCNGASIVHMLARNCNPGIAKLLRGRSFDMDMRDKDLWTPLIYAAHCRNAEFVKFLVEEGADIEAVDNLNRPALFFSLNDKARFEESKRCVEILLDRGVNVQSEVDGKTIFDLLLEYNNYTVGDLILAYLALQEENGAEITQKIRSRINSKNRFKTYFDYCKQQLSLKIYQSVNLFDILSASGRNLERYIRNEKLAFKLKLFQTKVEHFETTLSRRISETLARITLRKTAAHVICKIMKSNYDRFPYIADEIVSYFEKQDLESLISI